MKYVSINPVSSVESSLHSGS